jgi:hypothetical protein
MDTKVPSREAGNTEHEEDDEPKEKGAIILHNSSGRAEERGRKGGKGHAMPCMSQTYMMGRTIGADFSDSLYLCILFFLFPVKVVGLMFEFILSYLFLLPQLCVTIWWLEQQGGFLSRLLVTLII